MKQLFALFCAIVLMPSFSAHAWIGGPFSNNTYFGENGDDGVYEAVGFPTSGVTNGIGIFRWAVTNNATRIGPDDIIDTSTIVQTFRPDGSVATTTTFVTILPTTSNVFLGGLNRISHSWFIEGVSYTGLCTGTANSGIGLISCVGNATAQGVPGRVSSGFQASISNSGRGLPVRRFSGEGSGAVTDTATTNFSFLVFGSKVTDTVIYNGIIAN